MPAHRKRTRPPLEVRLGALCRADPAMHDAPSASNYTVSRAHIRRAAEVCGRCPVLTACDEWASAQPKNSLDGVIAGRLYRTDKYRPRP